MHMLCGEAATLSARADSPVQVSVPVSTAYEGLYAICRDELLLKILTLTNC